MRTRLMIGLLLLLMTCVFAALAEEVTITCPEKIAPYDEKALTVTVPADGTITISIGDKTLNERNIATDLTVHAGENTVLYNALSYNDQPLRTGEYTVTGVFTSESGDTLECTAPIRVITARGTVQYALCSSDVFYLDSPTTWHLDIAVSAPCVVTTEFFRADEPDKVLSKIQTETKKENKNYRVHWSGLSGGKKPASPGEYVIRCKTDKNPDYVIENHLTVESGERPVNALSVSPDFFPQDFADEQAVWDKLTEPVTVAEAASTSRVSIYEKPNTRSKKIGSIYCQSVAVKVIDPDCGDFCLVGAYCSYDGVYREGYVKKSYLKVVEPSVHYGIVLDKQNQTMDVYADGHKIGTVLVSTGHKSDNSIETRTGVYLTNDRLGNFCQDGARYDYAIRIDGSNLIHQVGYMVGSGIKADFSKQEEKLGTAASHGCVRIDYRVPQASGGINAYWCWTHLPINTKIMVLDEIPTKTQGNPESL